MNARLGSPTPLLSAGSPLLRALLLGLVLALGVSGCASLSGDHEPPELTLVNIAPMESGNLEQRFLLRFRLLNPNSSTLPVRGIRYRVNLLGETFASGASGQDFDVEPFSDTEFEVPVSISLLRTARVVLAGIERGPETLDYRLEARISTAIPFLGTVRVVEEGEVSLAGGALNLQPPAPADP